MLLEQDVRQLVDQCHVELTGASEGGIKAKMFEVMDEFFKDSSIWKECVTINVVPGQNLYNVQPTDGQFIRLNGVNDSTGGFIPALAFDPTVNEITLQSAPSSAQQYFALLTKSVALPMVKGLPNAPDWTLQKFHLAIKEGIIGNLMNEQNKSYSDKKGALYHLGRFRRFINEARSIALRANTVGASAWRFPQSFRSTSQQGGVPSFGGGFGDRSF